MVEGQVDDAIRSGGALLEAVQVLDRPAIDLRASGMGRLAEKTDQVMRLYF